MKKLKSLFKKPMEHEKLEEEIESIDSTKPKPKPKEVSIETYFADKVVSFSSQYGPDTSHSYAVINAAGPPRLYPEYGDVTDAAVFRTYGPWWKQAPSGQHQIGWKNPRFNSEDFIDLLYPKALYPTEVIIYETFSPGAVVRVLACDRAPYDHQDAENPCRWEVLWEGENHVADPVARKFVCKSKKIDFKTRHIRVEFNSTLCGYYTEVDAISLSGCESLQEDEDKLVEQFDQLSLLDSVKKPIYCRQATEEEKENSGLFKLLPAETLIYLMSYLDFSDFAWLSRSCRYMWRLCGDPYFYKKLNLKSYWPTVTDTTLSTLQERCSMLEELDFSWCGPFGMVSADAFHRFIGQLDGNLKILRLAACDFLNVDTLSVVAVHCRSLTELDLQSCTLTSLEVNSSILSSLSELRRLNVARVQVGDNFLIPIFNSCSKLQHINLGGNRSIHCPNDIFRALSKSCTDLRSLDLWRMRSQPEGADLQLLTKCKNLEELDVGWCQNVNNFENPIPELAKHCKNLKKIFFTACRSIRSEDMIAISQCPLLEQVDVLGNSRLSSDSIESVLEHCKHLTMVDVSFCSQITGDHVLAWKIKYPKIDIKKSFVS